MTDHFSQSTFNRKNIIIHGKNEIDHSGGHKA